MDVLDENNLASFYEKLKYDVLIQLLGKSSRSFYEYESEDIETLLRNFGLYKYCKIRLKSIK